MSTLIDRLPELMTVPQAASWLGIGSKRLRRLIREGQLPIVLLGVQPRLRVRDLETWLGTVTVRETPHSGSVVMRRLAREQSGKKS